MPGTTKKWDEIHRNVRLAQRLVAHVGILESKGGTTKPPGSDLSLVEIGAVHEFGSADGRIPERSWLRSTFIVRRANALAARVAETARAIVAGADPRRAISLLGAWGASEVKSTITEIDIPPPLADSTVMTKGSSKPLVDTGQLVNAITWEVTER